MDELQASSNHTDLVDAVRIVLKDSCEPLTVTKIRERLPEHFRRARVAELTELLQRQVAACVLVMCPKYRSGQDRYWDRPLRQHAKVLLHEALAGGPRSWTELRKKLPKYLRHLAESVLNEELARGAAYRHPPASARMGPRYALEPADVRCYADRELRLLMTRFEHCGFSRPDAREALMQLLQEEEWSAPRQRLPVPATPADVELCPTPAS